MHFFKSFKKLFQQVQVLASPRISVSLTRIVISGGGKTGDGDDVTHYFLTQDKEEMLDDQKVKKIVERGAHMCLSDYIGSFPFVFI